MEYQNGQPLLGHAPAGAHGPSPKRISRPQGTVPRTRGYQVDFLPEEDDNARNRAMNFVTLAPRRILMVEGCDRARGFYESLGITCTEVDCSELIKAAGAIGCLTGVLQRDML